MNGPLRTLLKLAGKGERKVVAVFAIHPASCHAAVLHVREGAPGLPVWAFSTAEVLPETTALCEQVRVGRGAMVLLFRAERELWPHWVAMSVATWTGGRGKWPLKLAPFLVPPFRTLLLNENGDFFPGTPAHIASHCARRVRDACRSAGQRVLDIGRFCWQLVSYHIPRSAPVRRVRDNLSGFSLLLASLSLRAIAAVMGLFSFSPQAWFQRAHGNQPLDVIPEPATGAETARLPPTARAWDGPALEDFARSSAARWIVWQDSRGDGAIDDMLPLLDDPRTFAVSRQTHFRAWKSMLFPLAPFRTLQPGEASQVLAPLSGTIVVDRRKLLALGIPRTGLPGTAWMLLFWKAAAAGWRSYSVGQGSRLREQPDFPMQDTGFLLRFLASRALRSLGPREPDLARGSIAFSPRHRGSVAFSPRHRPPGSPEARLTVLVIAPFLPFPLSHGGAVRMFNLCRALADRVDFVLAAVRESQDTIDYDRLHEVFRDVRIVDKDERACADDRLPDQVRQHQLLGLRAVAADLARQWNPGLVQVEYTHLAALRDAVPGVPALLVEHDLTFSLYRQLAEKPDAGDSARREYQRWLDFERYWLGVYDGVWTVSDDDRRTAIAESGRAADSTFSIPNGVDLDRFVVGDEPAAAPEIFYVGSFRHLPNVLGFQKLRQEVMPRVWSRMPDARLRVVAGPQHELFWNRFAPRESLRNLDSRIVIHGFVEDLRPLYATASVVVVPLEVSAGTNIKVLEAMACGKPVVTTPIGCAGLGLEDRGDAWIDADWAAFAASVSELLSDTALRQRTGRHARRTVEQRFGWRAIADCAFASYLRLAKTDGRPRT